MTTVRTELWGKCCCHVIDIFFGFCFTNLVISVYAAFLTFLRLPIEAGSQLIGAGFHCFSVFRIFADFFFHNFVVEKILSLREAHERFLTFSIILKPGPSKNT